MLFSALGDRKYGRLMWVWFQAIDRKPRSRLRNKAVSVSRLQVLSNGIVFGKRAWEVEAVPAFSEGPYHVNLA
ncbi:MAG TPA: hypothetical protein V6D13_06510 [Halomicronema sp.]